MFTIKHLLWAPEVFFFLFGRGKLCGKAAATRQKALRGKKNTVISVCTNTEPVNS